VAASAKVGAVASSDSTVLRVGAWLLRQVRTSTVDLGIWVAAPLGAFLLRSDGAWPPSDAYLTALAVLLPVKLVVSALFDLHRQSWRAFAFADAQRVAVAMMTAAFVATGLVAA